MTKKETYIINNIRECAEACSEDAAELKKECKALYEEVKDFIDYEKLDLDDYLYGVKLTLKDEAELTFTTDTETAYHDKDTKVRIMETGILGIHHYSYRDDFVEDYVDYIKDGINELCEQYDHDCIEFEDELNAAGELLYYSLLKTALIVVKERMAKWEDEDDCEDDDEE
jgi:hypothetical protein